jgi:hypothetical protein
MSRIKSLRGRIPDRRGRIADRRRSTTKGSGLGRSLNFGTLAKRLRRGR